MIRGPHTCGGVRSTDEVDRESNSHRRAALAALSLATQGAAARPPSKPPSLWWLPSTTASTPRPERMSRVCSGKRPRRNWVSCGTNDVCGAREQVIAAIVGRHKAIPDLKWEIKEVLVWESRHGARRGHRHPGRRVHGRAAWRQVVQTHVDRCSHHRSRQACPLLPMEDWLGVVRQLSRAKGTQRRRQTAAKNPPGSSGPGGEESNKLTIGAGAGNLNVRCWHFSEVSERGGYHCEPFPVLDPKQSYGLFFQLTRADWLAAHALAADERDEIAPLQPTPCRVSHHNFNL